jgi:hypothetical protein
MRSKIKLFSPSYWGSLTSLEALWCCPVVTFAGHYVNSNPL